MIEILALIVFCIFLISGIGLTLAGIGGGFLILLGALLYDLITWSLAISPETIAILLALAVLGELLEWVVTYYGMKAHGTSRNGIAGMFIGAFTGASLLSFIPIAGTLIGFVVGAVIGTYIAELIETRKSKKAWKAAKASLIGRGLVILCKFTTALIQAAIVFKEIIQL